MPPKSRGGLKAENMWEIWRVRVSMDVRKKSRKEKTCGSQSNRCARKHPKQSAKQVRRSNCSLWFGVECVGLSQGSGWGCGGRWLGKNGSSLVGVVRSGAIWRRRFSGLGWPVLASVVNPWSCVRWGGRVRRLLRSVSYWCLRCRVGGSRSYSERSSYSWYSGSGEWVVGGGVGEAALLPLSLMVSASSSLSLFHFLRMDCEALAGVGGSNSSVCEVTLLVVVVGRWGIRSSLEDYIYVYCTIH